MTTATADRVTVYAVRGVGMHPPAGRDHAGSDAATAAPDLALLPRALRRGLSAGMKFAIAAAGQAVAQARRGPLGQGDPAWPIVYGSSTGETATAIELLTSIVATRESSPVGFRHSVHNAAPGLLSIALGSQASSIAVAAGAETLLAALLEATALLNEGAPAVLLVLAEEGAPALLVPGKAPGAGAGALAWVLAPVVAAPAGAPEASGGSDGDPAAVAYLTAPVRFTPAAATPAASAADPLAPAWALAAALGQITAGATADSGPVISVGLSPRQPWRVQVAAVPQVLA